MNRRLVHRGLAGALAVALAAAVGGCSGPKAAAKPAGATPAAVTTAAATPAAARPTVAMPSVQDAAPRDYPGIHNAVAYHPGFVSGSAPEGDEGYDTLAAMGVRTIVSVDGAVPPVNLATARGMRYIHLPIGYNGFDEERKQQLVRAVRDAMQDGPVYIHCHHGKHRSAGAAAAVAASLGWMTADQGVARMKVSGTAPNYTGLYACAASAAPMTVAVIDAVPASFPAVWTPSSFVQGMVEIDEVMEHLKAIEAAGWKSPPNHPDLVPAAEAGRLVDLHRVLLQGDYAARKPASFASLMLVGQERAQVLEDLLVAGKSDTAALSAQFKALNASCKDCHAQYRD